MHALGLEFGSAAQLSKRPGSVWNCLWGNALKRSPGIIRKSRVSYPGPGFLSSATWPSLPKKHYNGLNLNLNLIIIKCDIFSHTWLNSHYFSISRMNLGCATKLHISKRVRDYQDSFATPNSTT